MRVPGRAVSAPRSADSDSANCVAVLSSGGLDSAVLVGELLKLGHVVQPIYVRFGLVWEKVEENQLRRFLETLPGCGTRPVVTLDFPIADVYGSHWSVSGDDVPDATSTDDAVYLPGRNLLLLAKSSIWCALHDVRRLALGTLKGNPFADSSRAFFSLVESAVHTALDCDLEVLTPFAGLTKSEVLERGRGLELQHTFSCIDPQGDQHCGHCNKCAERRRAFAALGINDGTRYAAL
jgi:7-cyano-7-deazaguanine synthase